MAIFNDVDVLVVVLAHGVDEIGVIVVLVMVLDRMSNLGLGPTGSRGEDRLVTNAHTQVLLLHPEDSRSTTSSVSSFKGYIEVTSV